MKRIDAIIAATRGRNPDNPSERAKSNGMYQQMLEVGGDIANTLTSVQKDNYVIEIYARQDEEHKNTSNAE